MLRRNAHVLVVLILITGYPAQTGSRPMERRRDATSPANAAFARDASQSQSELKRGFLSRLEEVLSTGLADSEEPAINACVALAFSVDTRVMKTALLAARHRASGQRVLGRVLIDLSRTGAWKNDAGAKCRLMELLDCSLAMDESGAFLWLLVYHLDSERQEVRLVSVAWLLEASDYLHPLLPKKNGPPVRSMIRNLRDLKKMARAKQRWAAWLSHADGMKVNRAVSSMFRYLKKSGKRKDKIVREFLMEKAQQNRNPEVRGHP